jgi:hypothetical protein
MHSITFSNPLLCPVTSTLAPPKSATTLAPASSRPRCSCGEVPSLEAQNLMAPAEQIVELVSTKEIELFLPLMREIDFGDPSLGVCISERLNRDQELSTAFAMKDSSNRWVFSHKVSCLGMRLLSVSFFFCKARIGKFAAGAC